MRTWAIGLRAILLDSLNLTSERSHRYGRLDPDLVIVHATAPLLSDGLGKRDAIRKWFGFGTSNDGSNLIRNQFNDLMRTEFGRDPLFDVARMESTRPDGTRTGFRKDGKFICTMATSHLRRGAL